METTNINTTWEKRYPKASLEDIEDCYSLVVKHYSKPNRHYHNLNHIKSLISQIKQLSLTTYNENILINVAIFHDVVYVSDRKDNEQKSAEFARNWLSKLNMDDNTSQIICDIIRATSNHESNDFLTQLFIDMDLSILGENELNYQKYISQIRKEHYKVPNYLYKIGRKRFLTKMLSRTFIFSTPKYYESLEKIARKNITNELNSL
ncbi:hypothetical protein N7U66_01950 [Lacinutrix neustonica]|uniref:HD domain-containing protein n=1 Tax=Lacinutrix neustonica TaxID=2980107 RepID=A0A9E8MX43_9FLAO|nr:hypothetical protein [Lacinutrix neustonica]WAC02499.1 hypothetical protein N7U66_01950 [Lacinutrix neustonica]